MQFFLYQSSQIFDGKHKKETVLKFMNYLKNIFDNDLPKFLDLDTSGENKQILYSCANSLDSHDILHTALSIAAVDKFMPNEAKSINRVQIYESLLK